jgi:hypothetical protein
VSLAPEQSIVNFLESAGYEATTIIAFLEGSANGGRLEFSESDYSHLDFARCQRPDGTFYGTAGECDPKQGKPVADSAGEKPKTDERTSSTREPKEKEEKTPEEIKKEKMLQQAKAQGSDPSNNRKVVIDGNEYGWAKKDGKFIMVPWGSVAGIKGAEPKKLQGSKPGGNNSSARERRRRTIQELKSRLDELEKDYAEGTGKPCGASHISREYICRKGEGQLVSRDTLPEYWRSRAEFGEAGYDRKLEKNSTTHTGEKPPALVEKMKPYTKLSSDEKAAVHMYGAAGAKEELYGDLNMMLRTGKIPPEDKEQAVRFVEQNLTKALDKLPNSSGKFYRAVSGGGAQALAEVKPGDIIKDRGFGSYSDKGGSNISPFLNSRMPDDNIVMVVNAKNFKNISPVAPYDEGEHLSTPGTQLRLDRIDPKGTWSRKLNNYVLTYYFEQV